MSEYQANKELKVGAATVRDPRARTRSSDARYPAARFIFRVLFLATWGAGVYNAALAVLS